MSMIRPLGLRALPVLATLCMMVLSCGETAEPTDAGPKKPTPEQAPNGKVVATPAGGTYAISDSVTLSIPAGAVSEETTLEFRILTADELAEIFKPSGRAPEELLLGFEGTPDGQTFAKPITLSFSGLPLKPGDRINVYEVDKATKAYTLALVGHTVRPAEGVVELNLLHFSIDAATLRRREAEAKKAREEECNKPETKCRCGDVENKPESRDVICTAGDCQVIEAKWETIYKECGYSESSRERELTEGCRLGIGVSANPESIETLESSQITAHTYLGCSLAPLEGEKTTFSVSGLGTLSDSSASTDGQGKARTTFEAGSETGEATVTARTEASYRMYERVATRKTELGTFTETELGPERTESAEAQTTIAITEVEHWQVVGKVKTSYSLFGPGGYHWVDWSVAGEAEVSFSFDLDRAAILAGGHLDLVTTGTGTQTASAVIDAFDPKMYASASIKKGHFPSTLTFESIEITGWAQDGGVAIYVLACIKPDTSACCDGHIYRYDIEVCDAETFHCIFMPNTFDYGANCLTFGGEPMVVEGTQQYSSSPTYGHAKSYTLTLTQE